MIALVAIAGVLAFAFISQTRRLRRETRLSADRLRLATASAADAAALDRCLRESQQRLAGIVEAATDAIVAIDDENRITLFNREAERIFQCSREVALGMTVDRFIPRRFRERCGATRDPVLGQMKALRYSGEAFPIDGTMAEKVVDGRTIRTILVREGQAPRADEGRRDAEEPGRVSADPDLSHRLIEAHESERRRIARELHDDVGQRMAVLTMELDALDRALPLTLTELRSRLRAVSDRALDVGKDIQAISHSLHWFKLDYMGLAMASERFCRDLSAQHHVEIAFTHADVPDDLPQDAAVSVFRVLQEAVTNAVKHAGVPEVTAALRGSPDEIQLEVIDAGRGFDPDAAMRGSGLGLISMRERIALVKGELSITSQPSAGTTVRARVPLRQVSSLACA